MLINIIFLDLLVLFIVSLKTCVLLAQHTYNDIKFRKVIENSVTNGDTLAHIEARSPIECGLQCIKSDGCDGINYALKSGTGRQKTLCELVRRSAWEDSNPAITHRAGWRSYIQTQVAEPRVEENHVTTAENNNLEALSTRPPTISPFEASTQFVTQTVKLQETTEGFEDTNPEYCNIQAAFVNNNHIYLVSGEAIYTFSDISEFLSGPIQTLKAVDLLPGIAITVTAMYLNTEQTQLYVIEDDTVKTFSEPASGVQWSLSKSEPQLDFWGTTYTGVTSAFSHNGDVVVLLGDRVTQIGVSKSCKIASMCSGNVLMSNNNNDSPGKVTASCSLDTNTVLMFDDNLVYSFTKSGSDVKGTWKDLGSVKCH